jgi:hypothetical protein
VDKLDIAFIGRQGDYSSVKIFQTIAERLGIAFYKSDSNEIDRKKLLVCVKPFCDFTTTSFGGKLVWIPIDANLPAARPDLFLCCSKVQESAIKELLTNAETHVIPHYHCNLSNNLNRDKIMCGPEGGKWIGTNLWVPSDLPRGVEQVVVNSRWSHDQLERVYNQAYYLLNARKKRRGWEKHLRFNTGIKLINAMGFMKLSISEPEPALLEWGSDCSYFLEEGETLISAIWKLTLDIRKQCDILRNCKMRRDDFSIENVARQFERLFEEF